MASWCWRTDWLAQAVCPPEAQIPAVFSCRFCFCPLFFSFSFYSISSAAVGWLWFVHSDLQWCCPEDQRCLSSFVSSFPCWSCVPGGWASCTSSLANPFKLTRNNFCKGSFSTPRCPRDIGRCSGVLASAQESNSPSLLNKLIKAIDLITSNSMGSSDSRGWSLNAVLIWLKYGGGLA